jgi:hypothetical protein
VGIFKAPLKAAFCMAALAAAAALAATGATATAGTSLGCPGTSSHPFVPWLDPASYTLAPGGAFEGTTPWQLSGGAKVVSGNEPFKVHSSTDSRSLSIPAGATATSPSFCVGVGYPTLRFFAVGGNLTSPLRVDVIYSTVLGTVTQPVGLVPATSYWGPTPPQLLLANVTGLLSLNGLTSSVRLRFTALGSAGWHIDDVYVDPWKMT